MQQVPLTTPASPSQTIAQAQNRVLRNTYALLALSMVPTVLGAWIGVQMKFTFFQANPAIGFIAFLAIAFGFMFAIEKTKNSGWGVAILLGFTFFMGLLLSRMLGVVLGFRNGASLIGLAGGGTAVIFAIDGLGRLDHRSATCRAWASSCSSAWCCCWWRRSPTSSCSCRR